MPKKYHHLLAQDRAVIMVMRTELCSIRAIAKKLKRTPSTISREVLRADIAAHYDANLADDQAFARRKKARRIPKLSVDGSLFAVVQSHLKALYPPQQIAGILKLMHPDDPSKTVSHETIYNALYLHPKGELKRELIACLRFHRKTRVPRSRGTDRRGQIKDMQSIHIRPPEAADRVITGHWEGDLIKGAANASSVGTLVERTSRFVVLAKVPDAGTRSVVDSFSLVLNRQPASLRKTMTYDQGREMHGRKILTQRTGVQIYFADPHSPWQRGSNENTNGLLRQYLPKGADLSVYSQDELDAIALSLNTRPRKTLGWKTPLAFYTEHMIRLQQQPDSLH